LVRHQISDNGPQHRREPCLPLPQAKMFAAPFGHSNANFFQLTPANGYGDSHLANHGWQ
jgi:hypothetical protein